MLSDAEGAARVVAGDVISGEGVAVETASAGIGWGMTDSGDGGGGEMDADEAGAGGTDADETDAAAGSWPVVSASASTSWNQEWLHLAHRTFRPLGRNFSRGATKRVWHSGQPTIIFSDIFKSSRRWSRIIDAVEGRRNHVSRNDAIS